MINCKKHAIERWTERILNIKDEKSRDEYIREHNEQIKENMNKTFDYAEFVYRGQIGDNTTKNYYIHNHIVFVTNTTDDAIITVFNIDFNFTPAINLQVAKGLVKEIKELVQKKEDVELKSLIEKEKLEHEKVLLENEEELLKEQIKIVQSKKKSVDESIKNINSETKLIELNIKKYTNNLVNSKEYREDLKSL